MTLANVNESNLNNILQAVHDIAVANCGLTLASNQSEIGEWPVPTVLGAAGTPFLTVRNAKWLGYSNFGTGLNRGPQFAREMGQRELVWNIEIRVFFAYSNTELHYDLCRTVTTKLEAAFQKYDTLPDANGFPTCEEGTPHTLDWDYIGIGGKTYLWAGLFVAAREVQEARYR